MTVGFTSVYRLVKVPMWIKNILVFIPLFFADLFLVPEAILLSILAFFGFAFAASGVYIMNDLIDVERDRLHPRKKKRAIASGEVSEKLARGILFFALAFALGFAFVVDYGLFLVISVYLFLNLAYTFYLKHVLFLDVISVAFGYVLRVVAGSVVLAVRVSEWMMVLIFLLALFGVVIKRRQEIQFLDKKSKRTRKVLSFYSVELLDQINSVIVPTILVSYIFYTFQARLHSPFMLATIPVVLYAFLRFLYLVKNTDFGMSSSDYKKDWGIVISGVIWAALVMLTLLGY
jgi:4-hydroxybenzoate polyprenyltransferase